MPKFVKFAFLLGVVSVALSATSPGVILLHDTFEAYLNQEQFESVWMPAGTAGGGTLSTVQAQSGVNSVNVGTLAALRNDRSFEETGFAGPVEFDLAVRFSFDFYDSNADVSPYRQYATLIDSSAATSNGGLISIGLNNNLTSAAEGGNFYMARVLGLFEGNPFFKLNENPELIRTTGWHNLGVEISTDEFGGVLVRFFVDGQLAKTLTGMSLRSYDVVRIGAGFTSTHEAFYDNILVENFVPEPTTGALALAGAVALLRRRRR